MDERQINSTAYPMNFYVVDTPTQLGKSSASPTVLISKNSGSFTAPSGSIVEIGRGWYVLSGNATDRNTLGEFIISGSATGADPIEKRYSIVAHDPFSSGSYLDVAVSGRASASSVDQIYTNMATVTEVSESSASSVWNKSLAVHTTVGTTGSKLNVVSTASSLSGITGTSASTIWEYADRKLTSASNLNLASASSLALIPTNPLLTNDARIPDMIASASLVSAITGTSASTVWTYGTRALTDKTDFSLSETSASSVVDKVWDEVLTAATHNVPTSSGRRVRQLTANIILDAVITGATTNTLSFDGDAATNDGAYDPGMVTITTGNGIGQTRMIYQYNGTTKTAIVDRDWKVIPSAGDECIILSDSGREHVNEGVLQSGSALAVQLNTYASSTDNAYVGQTIFLRSGTGADQAFKVITYDGTTKIATTRKPLNPIPDNTTAYVMLPTGELDVDRLVDSIWNEDLSGHTTSGTSGSALSTSTAASIWSYASRTLTSFGTFLSGVASDVWNYARRTLTSIDHLEEAVIDNDLDLDIYRGETMSIALTDLGDLNDVDKIYFTVKKSQELPDSQAIIQISSASGLIYLNSASASSVSTSGSIAITDLDTGAILITMGDEQALQLVKNSNLRYDVKAIRGTTSDYLRHGEFVIHDGVTDATT